MNIDIQKSGNISILGIKSNRLDSSLAPDIKSKVVMLDTEEDGDLIINLDSVTFADSSGLGSLLMAQRLYRDNGRSLVLAGVPERVRKLLEISQLSNVFVLFDNTDDALNHLLKE